MGAIQSSIGGVVSATLGAVKKTTEAVEKAEKESLETPKTDVKNQVAQNRVMNKVIDKAALANQIAMMHTEARITQSQAFKERLEAVKTGKWKASRTKLKRRGK